MIFELDGKILNEWGNIIHALETYSPKETADPFEIWFNSKLDEPEAWHRKAEISDGIVIPETLATLIAAVARIEQGMSVMDPACGIGSLLAAAMRTQNSANTSGSAEFFGTDKNLDASAISFLRLHLLNHKNAHIHIKRRILPNRETTSDIILSAPPAGIQINRYEFEYLSEGIAFQGGSSQILAENAITVLALTRLRPGGRAVILIPRGLLFRTGDASVLRRRMVAQGELEAVINLPAGILAPLTHIQTALLVLRTSERSRAKDIIMIDASEAGVRNKRQTALSKFDCDTVVSAANTGKCEHPNIRSRIVSPEEIEKNEFDLMVNRYFPTKADTSDISLSKSLEKIQKMEIQLDEISIERNNIMLKLIK
jgi:type I restriction enzyme M protein